MRWQQVIDVLGLRLNQLLPFKASSCADVTPLGTSKVLGPFDATVAIDVEFRIWTRRKDFGENYSCKTTKILNSPRFKLPCESVQGNWYVLKSFVNWRHSVLLDLRCRD